MIDPIITGNPVAANGQLISDIELADTLYNALILVWDSELSILKKQSLLLTLQ